MASTLQSIYRKAFNSAFSVARLAEQAYRFERPGDTATLLEPTYWEAGKAGLLSGEKLAVDLVAMEKRYLETNYRTLEITRSEEHTSELQSLMRISYAVFCWKKKNK